MCMVTRECKRGWKWAHALYKRHAAYLLLLPLLIVIISVYLDNRVLQRVKDINHTSVFNARVELVDTVLDGQDELADIVEFVDFENTLPTQVMRVYNSGLQPITSDEKDNAYLLDLMQARHQDIINGMKADYDRMFFNKAVSGVDIRGYQRKFVKQGDDYHLVFVSALVPGESYVGNLYNEVEHILGINALISLVLNLTLVGAFLYYQKIIAHKEKRQC